MKESIASSCRLPHFELSLIASFDRPPPPSTQFDRQKRYDHAVDVSDVQGGFAPASENWEFPD